MKKRDLRRMAILGIASGLMTICQSAANASELSSPSERYNSHQLLATAANTSNSKSKDDSSAKDHNESNLGYHLYTEDELLLELNDQGIALYKSLDPAGKALARRVASQRCDHTNECKGLNACATDKNTCAGQGECKGQGKCAFSDKNLAVKAVADKLAKQRAKANQGK